MMEQPSPMGSAPVVEPSAIKVFGILHLVFGGLGIFALLYALAQFAMPEVFIQMSAGGDEDMVLLQRELQASLRIPSIISTLVSAVVTILILRAGFKLVKGKKDAAQASQLYSLSSMAGKLITIAIALLFTIPATNAVFEHVMSANTLPSSAGLEQTLAITKTFMAATAVVFPLILAIYPLLSLILLKKKAVTDYLAAHGK